MNPTSGHRRCRARRDDRGAITSLALTAPLLVLLLMLIVQSGMAWHANNVVEAASIDGLRAAQGGGDGAATANAIVAGSNSGGLLNNVNVNVNTGPETIQSTVSADVVMILPIPLGPWTVTATSVGPTERFVAEQDR